MSDLEKCPHGNKDWLHVTEVRDHTRREIWYSPNKDVSAVQRENWIELREHSSGVYHSFDMNEQLLYRVPEYVPIRQQYYARMAETLEQIVHDEKPPADPLSTMKFLAIKDGTELVSHSLSKVERDGQQCWEYRLTLHHAGTDNSAEYRFNVDPVSRLLQHVYFSGTMDRQPRRFESHFEYPDSGPSDIYGLGVPRSAKLIDRILSPEIQNIVDTHRSGRLSMDDYRAIVTEGMPDLNHIWWLGERTKIIYRKGNKFRVDAARWFGGLSDYCMIEKPGEDVDMEAWWRERVGVFIYCPCYLSSDSMVHRVELQPATDAEGDECWRVESIDSRKECGGKSGDVFPPYYSCTPEFACRPPMGIPNQTMEAVLSTTPVEGPPGTILLEVRNSGAMPTCSGGSCDRTLPEQPNVWRFWLDPLRGFAAVRWDMVLVRESGEEKWNHSTLIEEMAQSPNGTWYAKRMRNKAAPPVEYDEVFDFYIDFDVDLPDSFFEPPRVGDTFK